MTINQLLQLNKKKLWFVIVGGFVSIILHNLVSGLLGIEEAFFFSLVIIIIPAYLLISIPYTLIIGNNKKAK